MSENVELKSCSNKTENAFNEIQADSKEDFITLSDLIPTTNSGGLLLEEPSDGCEKIINEIDIEVCENVEITDSSWSEPLQDKLRRHKKTSRNNRPDMSDSSFSDDNLKQKSDVSIEINPTQIIKPRRKAELTKYPKNSSPKPVKKRGRKRKDDCAVQNSTDQNINTENLKSSILLEDSCHVGNSPLMIPPKKKRGRPKKVKQESLQVNLNISDNSEVESVNVVSSTTNEKACSVKSKRGRKKKDSVEKVTVEKIPDLQEISSITPLNLKTIECKNKYEDNNYVCDGKTNELESTSNVCNDTLDIGDSKDDLCFSTKKSDIGDADDICLSELKKGLRHTNNDKDIDESKEYLKDHKNDMEQSLLFNDISKKHGIADDQKQNEMELKEQPVEPTTIDNDHISSRPKRHKAKQTFKYDEGSDEDPFANIELSDDEPHGGRRGKFDDDTDYVPGNKKKYLSQSSSGEDFNEDEVDTTKKQKKRKYKVFDKEGNVIRSPKKRRGKNIDLQSDDNLTNHSEISELTSGDVEDTIKGSVVHKSETTPDSTKIENYLAQKIQSTEIKIMKTFPSNSSKTPFDIPILNPNEIKKGVEIGIQTNATSKVSASSQTDNRDDLSMKEKVKLSSEQAVKACEFLTNIVKTTSELGQLMTQKSDDFIKKKINTKYVTDTFTMDYCVKKSFLLFKLAKHNLIQMEEDLANQYEEFLKTNALLQHREEKKIVIANDNDSDCEIVEVMQSPKPKFNPKTVFLNKELSIKIAKKEEPKAKFSKAPETVNKIKGRHAVWLNDSIMVKKVKPNQSFLAQDSRNKKPPDTYITVKMVKDFFDQYYKDRMSSICQYFASPDWFYTNQEYVCSYFIDDSKSFQNGKYSQSGNGIVTEQQSGQSSQITEAALNTCLNMKTVNVISNPQSLVTMCTHVIQAKLLTSSNFHETSKWDINDNKKQVKECISSTNNKIDNLHNIQHVPSLKNICIKVINNYLQDKPHRSQASNIVNVIDDKCELQTLAGSNKYTFSDRSFFNPEKLSLQSIAKLNSVILMTMSTPIIKMKIVTVDPPEKLSTLCLEIIKKCITLSENQCSSSTTALKGLNKKKVNGISKYKVQSLTQICCIYYNNILQEQYCLNQKYKVKTLANICFEYISTSHEVCSEPAETMAVAIDSVNTLSDEMYSNLENFTDPTYDDVNDNDDFEYDNDMEYADTAEPEESNWVSKVLMQELRSCALKDSNNIDSNDQEEFCESTKIPPTSVVHIKIEPQDLPDYSMAAEVKIEPMFMAGHNNISSKDIFPKQESIESSEVITECRLPDLSLDSSNTYDENLFESFVRTNKLITALENNYEINDSEANTEVFSQSCQRVRRQYDPDSDDETNTLNDSLNLLIPHSVEQAKHTLMMSSSDENEKISEKKKIDKRKPKTTKKHKVNNNVKDKIVVNEVAILTRRMNKRIKLLEKKTESSDSEIEGVPKQAQKEKAKEDKTKVFDDAIQCNAVDSTETTISEKTEQLVNNKKQKSYKSNRNSLKKIEKSPDLDLQVPSELLECEPEISTYDSEVNLEMTSKVSSSEIEIHDKKQNNVEDDENKNQVSQTTDYIEKDGWMCFKINNSDTKLYEYVSVLLDKLPESFVETYFKYVNTSDNECRDDNDDEVDKLTNLHSLNRNSTKDHNIIGQVRKKDKCNRNLVPNVTSDGDKGDQHFSDNNHFAELSPSEDEMDLENNMPLAPMPRSTENNIAKNFLMDDNESDEEQSIKTENVVKMEPEDETFLEFKLKPGPKSAKQALMNLEKNKWEQVTVKKELDDEASQTIKWRPGPKSKTRISSPESTSVILTADVSLKKELDQLHAPIVIQEHVDVKQNKRPARSNPKSIVKKAKMYAEHKSEEDSSSEEEKQWVNTKEKLLKRIGKKTESADVEDAKRAKIVTDFIEKRGDKTEVRQRRGSKRKRSNKKLLERRKQMNILRRELYGDNPHTGKRSSQAYTKGRKNIRKVIDKTALSMVTVMANHVEFARKKRLSFRQAQLREHLGCEEGVNVVVINDELCLEYDFEQNQPIVTVHPFFTRVMKAHQYEGVKFMWDACFESVSMVTKGFQGGGCILAHCMGLGKTLQVLALLHTVLTQPALGIRRVLVCCPLSTVLNWVDEIHKWIGPVTGDIKVFELSKLKKTYERAYQLEDWYNGGGIFIVGYELFRSLTTLDPIIDDIRPTIVNKIRTALLDPGPDMIICDEGHLLKNDASVLAVAMSRVQTKRRIMLTGTPMQNNLREYYCMVNFVKPDLLGTYAEYSNRFENPIMNGQHRDSREEDIRLMKARTHILHKVLEGCLQRQEASVLYPYLPKKYEYTVFIPLTPCQRSMYRHYLENYARHAKNNILKDFHSLQKIWTHPQVMHNFQMRARDAENSKIKAEKIEDDLAHEDITASEDVKPAQTEVWWLQYLEGGNMLDCLESSNKFHVLFRLLDECIALGDKVLIFSTSLYTMDALEYFLKLINKWSLGKEYYRLDGSVPAEVRQKWCREFNAETNHNTKLFLISTRAGCLGLNMTAANRVIILDTSWNPAHDIQSIFRVYRFGQKKDCYIYRLVALGTMEQKIYERSVTKTAVACRVVDEQQIDRHYNSAELTELYSLDEDGWGVLAGVAAGVRDAALLRVAAGGALHAVREHDSLLRGSEPALPEHERAEAWDAFQKEHANPHMNNFGIVKLKKPKKAEIKSYKEPSQPNKDLQEEHKSKTEIKQEEAPLNQGDDIANEAVVKEIMQILISRKFHENLKPKEKTGLISTVRQMVASGMNEGFSFNNPITAGIARVLMQGEQQAYIPPATDIEPDDVQYPADCSTSSKTEDIKPEVINKTLQNERGSGSGRSRRSRDNPLMTEYACESDDAILDTNDDEWTIKSISQYQARKLNKTIDEKNKNTHKSKNKKQKNKAKKNETHIELKNEVKEYDSIILSDEEEESSLVTDSLNSKNVNVLSDKEEESSKLKGSSKNNKKEKATSKIKGSFNNNINVLSDEEGDSSTLKGSSKNNKKEKVTPKVKGSFNNDINVLSDEEDELSKFQGPHWWSNKNINILSDQEEESQKLKDTSYNGNINVLSDEDEELSKLKRRRSNRKLNILSDEVKKSSTLKESLNNINILSDDEEESSIDLLKLKKQKVDSDGPSLLRKKTKDKKEPEKVGKEKKGKSYKITNKIDKEQNEDVVVLEDVWSDLKIKFNNKEQSKEKEETVPLHAMFLNNPNFIKLVAHKYVDGNSMLDADAALLAAQYSTQKALKEIESTGRPITSGPIYEIAVQALGLDMMKKVNENLKSGSSAKEKNIQSTTDLSLSIRAPTVEKPNINSCHNERPDTKLGTRESTIVSTTTPATPLSMRPGVVPVGMIRRTLAPVSTNSNNNVEECILPDEDVPLGPVLTPKLEFKAKSNPIILRSVTAGCNTLPTQQTKQMQNENITPIRQVAEPQLKCVQLKKQMYEVDSVFCLDSDDDDVSISDMQDATNDASDTSNNQSKNHDISPPPATKYFNISASQEALAANPTQRFLPAQEQIVSSAAPIPTNIPPIPLGPPVKYVTPITTVADSSQTTTSQPSNQTETVQLKKTYVLPPSVQKMLDPTKKYVVVKARSIINSSTSPMPDGVQTSNSKPLIQKAKAPSIVITSQGKLQLEPIRSAPKTTTAPIQETLTNDSSKLLMQERAPISSTKTESKPSTSNVKVKMPGNSNTRTGSKSVDRSVEKQGIKIVQQAKYTNKQKILNNTLTTATKKKVVPEKDDPMNIFKYVVQIQAENYDNPIATQSKPNNLDTPRPNILGRPKSINPTKITSTIPTKLAPLSAKTSSNLEQKDKLVKVTIVTPKNKTEVIKSRIPDSIDLTDAPSTKNVNKRVVDVASSPRAGTSQRKPNKTDKNKFAAINMVDLTHNKTSGDKRSSTLVEKNPSKKVKAEQRKPPLTLKDFNLEDLDDIIELE
ncbi:uncharacterized protein LOC126972036 isoform X2 [Leptidea sinapis]|uniref:uncharacterized protein LOC126972036 isoform X2 n=1 Tax=Leptidea sinapis TaxID=189913 RepID=UPI0021445B20|nr:uncharacterized protein LOC126972036 isoform X2 [Leptidea sinapis]